jgi:hypothetical protein
MRQLGWDAEKYWRVRDELLDEGVLLKGRGRGGAVRRPDSGTGTAIASAAPDGASPDDLDAEKGLYAPIAHVLRNEWRAEMRLESLFVEITARQGRRSTGGKWTRPDLAGLSIRTFKYLPGKHVDVWTFEVKSAGDLDVTGVFEAAAHSRGAHRSIVMFQTSSKDPPDELSRCVEEARRFRIGLITFADPKDFGTWEYIVEAPRHDADPELIDEFVATQLSQEAKETLLKWQK